MYIRYILQNLTPVLFDATSIMVIFILHKQSFAPKTVSDQESQPVRVTCKEETYSSNLSESLLSSNDKEKLADQTSDEFNPIDTVTTFKSNSYIENPTRKLLKSNEDGPAYSSSMKKSSLIK